MNHHVVKNIRNTKSSAEIKKLIDAKRDKPGFCETCERWSYGIGRKRCEIHNPLRTKKESK